MVEIDECIGIFLVAASFKNIEDGWRWAIAGAYGPNVACDKILEGGASRLAFFMGFTLGILWGF